MLLIPPTAFHFGIRLIHTSERTRNLCMSKLFFVYMSQGNLKLVSAFHKDAGKSHLWLPNFTRPAEDKTLITPRTEGNIKKRSILLLFLGKSSGQRYNNQFKKKEINYLRKSCCNIWTGWIWGSTKKYLKVIIWKSSRSIFLFIVLINHTSNKYCWRKKN